MSINDQPRLGEGTASSTEMPFLKHVEELRSRLVKILLGLVAGTTIALGWSSTLFYHLTSIANDTFPIADGASGSFPSSHLIGTGPADAFVIKLKISLLAGFVISLPLTFYQLWRFIEPGMHPHERRYAIPFIVAGTLFFVTGGAFAFEVVLPLAFDFFIGEYQSIGVMPALRINEYLSFVFTTILVFGGVFELPVLSYFLTRVGIIDYSLLMRTLRHAIVTIFILAAILTPPDIVSQICLAVPMLLLYAMCIGIAYFAAPDRIQSKERTLAPASPDR